MSGGKAVKAMNRRLREIRGLERAGAKSNHRYYVVMRHPDTMKAEGEMVIEVVGRGVDENERRVDAAKQGRRFLRAMRIEEVVKVSKWQRDAVRVSRAFSAKLTKIARAKGDG